MPYNDLSKLLRLAFDPNRHYSAESDSLEHDQEYWDALDRFNGRTWLETKGCDIADRCPGFELLPDEVFIFFFPSILNSLISSDVDDQVTVSLRFYFRRMQDIIKKTSPLNKDQRDVSRRILESVLEECDSEGEKRPVEALLKLLG